MNFNFNYLSSPEFQRFIAGLSGANGMQQGRPTYTASGNVYNGPFGNDNRTPFRTVAPVQEGGYQPAYNRGLNASSAQLYDHFRQRGPAANYGFAHAGATQGLADFANRGALQMPVMPPPNPDTATSGVQGAGMVPSIFRLSNFVHR